MSDPIVDRRNPAQYPCADHEKRLSLTEQAVSSIKATNEGMTTKLDLILAQMTKVVILEERHNNHAIDITRAHSKVSDLEKRTEGALKEVGDKHEALAIEIREFMNHTKGQNKVLWAIGAVVGALLVKVLFFAANNGMTP